jgi:uncharacterized protein YoxC
MAMFAMWFQESDAISSYAKYVTVFIGLVAVAMAAQAIVVIVVALKASKTLKELNATATEVKGKALPLIDAAMEMSRETHALLVEYKPKLQTITDHLVNASALLAETSTIVKNSAQQFDKTITDANLRTQRQVARVDQMINAALNTTTEVVETINHGIKVPAQKIAGIASNLWYGLEGIMDRVKSKTGFAAENGPARPPVPPAATSAQRTRW